VEKELGFNPKPRVVTVKITWQSTDHVQMSEREIRGDHFMIRPEIPAIAKVFIKVPDSQIWLTSPPAGFLRWEGPLVEPGDEIVRVDLASGGESGPAPPVDKE
jgi:hypothetical protein